VLLVVALLRLLLLWYLGFLCPAVQQGRLIQWAGCWLLLLLRLLPLLQQDPAVWRFV
jgi:hypothetical protein